MDQNDSVAAQDEEASQNSSQLHAVALGVEVSILIELGVAGLVQRLTVVA